MKTIFASSSGTGDGTSQDKAASVQKACDLAQSGDSILFKDGDVLTTPFVRKGLNGIRLSTWNGKGATFRTAGGAVTLMSCNDVTIDGLTFEQADRDPRQPGYKYSMGADGLLFLGCNRPTIQNASIRFFGNGIVAQNVDAQGGTGGIVRASTIAENYNDTTAHSQGIYLAYQTKWLLEDVDFRMNGWHDLVPVAVATMFNHAVYSHDTQDGKSGPYVARRCVPPQRCIRTDRRYRGRVRPLLHQGQLQRPPAVAKLLGGREHGPRQHSRLHARRNRPANRLPQCRRVR